MDEETFSLPPRNEKPSPSKAAAITFSRALRLMFPAAFKPASTVPELTAKPAEIREYLARLLADKRGLPEDEASRVVAGCKIGSGLELRQYGAAMYLDVFGREYGWILFREVKISVRREKRLLTRYPLRKSIHSPSRYLTLTSCKSVGSLRADYDLPFRHRNPRCCPHDGHHHRSPGHAGHGRRNHHLPRLRGFLQHDHVLCLSLPAVLGHFGEQDDREGTESCY